ncbi:unnamed protein product [Caenorhabditis brenneri]
MDPNNCCRPMSDEEYREMQIESLKTVLPITLGILGVILISAAIISLVRYMCCRHSRSPNYGNQFSDYQVPAPIIVIPDIMDPNISSVILCHPDKEMMRESMKRQWIVMLMVVAMVLLSTAIVVVCEHFNRKWESQRSRKVTRIPKTPINEKRLILYNGSQFSENKTPEAKILISGPLSSKNKGSAKLNKILKMIFGLEDCKENLI